MTKITRGRDAGTGRFIPIDDAKRRKKTAIIDVMERKPSKPPTKPKKPRRPK